MKKTILFLIAVIAFGALQAQKCNAVFYNQSGKSFQLSVNGVLQNVDYQTNVKVTDLSYEGNYKVTLKFQDNTIPIITKNIAMMDNNTEYTYEAKQTKKGKYVLRVAGMVPIAQAPAPAPTQSVVTYSTTPPPATAATTVTETVTSSTTVTENGGNGNSENVSMNVSVGGVGMNVDVNVTDNGMNTSTTTNASSTTTYTETTTVTTTSSSDYGTTTETPATEEHYVMDGYSGPVGCPWPMSDADFAKVKQSIESKDFSDSKLTVAKQVTNSNCLTSNQAKQIMLLFDFEDTRLDYAKHAYGHTYDIGNYYQLNDAFDFESSIEELNTYIESQK